MSTKTSFPGALTGLVGALLLLAGCASTSTVPDEWDGLERVSSSQVDQLFVAPGAQIGPFGSVMVDEPYVAFDRNWDPNRGTRSTSRRVTQADMDRIRNDVARMLHDTFTQELARSGHTVVTAAQPDTLRVKPAIVNLYITAPDTGGPGRSQTLVMDAGRMTLFAEFRDGYTGKLLARVVDTRSGTSFGTMQIANSVTNTAEAQRAMTAWSRTLVQGLDAVNAAAQ